MDFVKSAHDRNRMCNVKRGIGEGCKGCPLDEVVKGVCSVWCLNNPEKAIEVVERWADDNPVETRQSVFLKQFPKAELDVSGVITICPAPLSEDYRNDHGGCKHPSTACYECRRRFWSQEVENE